MPMYGPTMLRVCFYLELPQTTVAMLNETVVYNLTMWHGAADLSKLTSKDVHMQILEPCLQDGHIALQPINFDLGNANIDTSAIREMIHAKILKLGFKQICASFFTQLCPGYSNQPHAVLKHICQTSTGFDGHPVSATIIKYYQHMMNTVRPFATQQRYAIGNCNRFIQGLEKTLHPSFWRLYPNLSTILNLDGSYQRHMLPTILAAAQAAKDDQNQIQEIARGMLVGQGFFVKAPGNAVAYASQAKNTLGQYKDGAPNAIPPRRCWGCGGNHLWMQKGKVVCPCGSEPQIVKASADRYAAWKAALKWGGGKSRSQAKG
jgi:hypothetical protein